ncbi:hypothetical protein [Streptomyces sp. NPDC050856]|uniref:hypothetical protein n=1 Tax=unclassified Streptomyces TaxID=2593676 RepID=UPI0033CDC6E3
MTVAAFLGAAGMTATTANAAAQADWTVTNPAADDTFSAVNVAGTTSVLTNKSTGAQVTCRTIAASGVAADGARPGGTGLATIQSATFGSSAAKCSGPLGSTWTATSTAPMSLNGTSYSAGVAKGTITGISIKLTGSSIAGACSATVTGSANTGSYTNATGVLEILNDATPALKISAVAGNCAGLLKNGDVATFTAKYKVTPVITVTGP